MAKIEIERELYLAVLKNVQAVKDDVSFPNPEDKLKAIFNAVGSVLDLEKECNESE